LMLIGSIFLCIHLIIILLVNAYVFHVSSETRLTLFQ
jgi:hypothetical protein